MKNGLIIGINEVGIGSLGGAIPSNLAKKISKEERIGIYIQDHGLDSSANLSLN